MALNLPTSSSTVKARIKTDIQSRLALSNPFVKGSWLRAFAESLGERMFDFYFAITQAIEEVFPDTTTDNLDRWGSFYNISRIAATKSSGEISFKGSISGVTMPLGHKLVDPNGNIFSTIESKDTESNIVSQSTLTQTAGLATFVGTTDHLLYTGATVVIGGAADAEYNGAVEVTVTADDTFTFSIDSGAPASTTGASFSAKTNYLTIQSDGNGDVLNLAQYTLLTLQTPIANMDDAVSVREAGLTGGSDQETTSAFRARLLDIIRNPISHFNVSDITRVSKAVALVTRVFVQESTPDVGQVTIYPMVDNEANPIPGAGTITSVKNAILGIKPANTANDDVIVSVPSAQANNYDFSALTPNTTTMRAAIEENLRQFYAEDVEVGVAVTEDSYRAVIKSTIDTVTGDGVTSFALTTPSSDLAATSSQIRTLGTFSYP